MRDMNAFVGRVRTAALHIVHHISTKTIRIFRSSDKILAHAASDRKCARGCVCMCVYGL